MKEKDIIIFDKVRSCCQDYHDERLGVIGDISTYLLLMMVSLSEGRPIDTLGRTIVNAINLTEKTPIITGFWEDGGVRFSTDNNPHDLYVRGLINVKKKSPIPALTA